MERNKKICKCHMIGLYVYGFYVGTLLEKYFINICSKQQNATIVLKDLRIESSIAKQYFDWR